MNEMRKLMEAVKKIDQEWGFGGYDDEGDHLAELRNAKLADAIERGVKTIWEEGFDTEDFIYEVTSAVLKAVGRARAKDRKLVNAIKRGATNVWDSGYDNEDGIYEINAAIINSVAKAGY